MKNTKATVFRLWQKVIALICAVALLAPLAIDYQKTAAQISDAEHKLVVLLVNNTLFEGDPDDDVLLTGKIYRYAEDLQAALPNTRTLVLPVRAEESPGDIFAALEKLYLEGQRRGEGKFRLSGVVLIGEVPLPIVRSGNQDAIAIFPYTDFESPSFVWQDSTDVFVVNDGSNHMQAEIFHGVIRAPGEASKTETEWLAQYFDKNHAYHSGETTSADQTLFFADLIGEFKSLHPLLLWMYEAAEGIFASDIAHYRYNFPLYEDAQAVFAAGVQNDIDLSAFPSAEEQIQAGDATMSDDFPYPDSLTHQYIRQYLPHFVKVASGFFSLADPLVKGSGRWMIDEGNVGTLPVYMSGMDVMSKEFLRELESEATQLIFEYIDTNIQKPVEVLTKVEQDWAYTKNGDRRERLDTYENQLNGRKMNYIEHVEQCTIIRGESPESPRAIGDNRQLVELNHLWNRFDKRMLSGDDQACDPYGGCCFLNSFTPEQCVNNAADQPIWDPIGGQVETEVSQKNFVECTRISKPKIWIATEDYKIVDDMPRTKLEFFTKEIPSTMLHNEPRPETITAAIKETLSGAIPADENHTISYRGPGGNVIKVILPDLVEDEFLSADGDGSIYNKFRSAYDDLEKEIRIQNLRSNFVSYVGYLKSRPFEYQMAPTTEFINPPIPSPAPVDPAAPIVEDAPADEEEVLPADETAVPAPVTPVPIRDGYVTDFWRVEPYQGMPYLEYQIDEVWKQAEEILQNRFPGTGDNKDLWIQYIESAPPDLKQQIEGLFQNIVDPITYDTSDLDLDRSDIISYQEFVLQEGGSLTTWTTPPSPQCVNNPLSPYCLAYFPMPHLQRWYPQTITFEVAPDPAAGFVIPFFDRLVTEFGAEPLEEFGEWRTYNADQKHLRAIELFFGNNTPEYLQGTSNGFEFSSMRALGNADEMWWGGEERVYIPGDDSDWDAALPSLADEEDSAGDLPSTDPIPLTDVPDEEPVEETPAEEENQCSEDAYITGVPITEWLPAMQCWLDDTLSKPLTIEMSPQCSYTGVLGESDYDIYSDAWNAGPPQVPNGARIQISGSSGNYLLAGDNATVTIRFERPDGSLITGGIDFVAEPIGDLKIVATDSQGIGGDSEYRDTTFSGEFVLPVTVTGDGRAGIRVSAERFGNAELVFALIGDGRLLLEETGGSSADTKIFRVSVLNENGIKLSGYNGQAVAQVSDPTAAQLLSSDVPITNGDGEVTVFHNGEASFVLTVTLSGFAPAQFGIAATPESEVIERNGDALHLRNPPRSAYAGEEVVIEVAAVDESGRLTTPRGAVTLESTTETAEGVTIRSLGENRFGITAEEKTGTLRLIANANGYQPLRISLPIVFRIDVNDIRAINPNTLAMSLLGSNFADFYRSDDPIANAILFSEVPQAVLSSINPIAIREPRLSVFNNGALRLFERGLEANIASYSPLTIRVFDRLHSQQLAEYALSFTGTSAIAAPYDGENVELSDGIFFRDFGGETVLESRQQGADLVISHEGTDILTVNPNINFSLLDNRFSLRYETDSDIPVVTLLYNTRSVGDFVINGATLAILDAPGGQTEFFAVPGNTSGTQGFSVVSDEEAPPIPTGGRFFETADQTFGLGFNLDDNFALQFASGVPLGEAARFGFGPNGIILGDPSVSLGIPLQEVEIEPDPLDPAVSPLPTATLAPTPTDPLADDETAPEEPIPQTTWEPKLFAGFDRGIGKELIRYPDKKIESAAPYDYNGDEYPDLLLATGEGKARVLMNLGDLGFRDVGEIVADASGLHSPVAINTQADGYDEIIALDDASDLTLFHNTSEVMERNTDQLTLPTGKFVSLKAADFDQDGFDDLLAQDTEGRLVILWGAASGYSDTESTELGNFGTQIEEGNLAENNTLISIPNITERSSNTIPLYIKAPVSEADGLTTVDDVLVTDGAEEEEALTDPTFAALLQTQQQFPQSFGESAIETRRAGLQNIALFATIDDVADGLAVELTMSDENTGAVNKGDQISFALKLDNNSNRDLHFALAHVLNPALAIIESSLVVPDSWPEDRPEPRIQTLSQGQLRILGIRLNEGESRTFRFVAEMTQQLEITPVIRNDLAFEEYPADGMPDVTVIIPGLNGQYHYLSQGGRGFTEYFEYASASEAADILGEMTDTDDDGVPDTFLNDTNGDGRIDVSDQVFDRFKTDTDGDGYPDSWDEMNGVWDDYQNEDWRNALEQFQDIGDEIMSYTACDGGCLNIPINFAFLVPGTFNLFDTLVDKLKGIGEMASGSGGDAAPGGDIGVSPELQQFVSGAQEAVSGLFGGGGGGMLSGAMDKVTGFIDDTAGEATDLLKRVQEGLGLPSGPIVGSPVFGIIPGFPFVCSGAKCYEQQSTFRMYVSPTLTGGVGVAFCVGVFPGSFCKAFAPSKLNISFLCDEPQNNRGIVNETDSGSCSFASHKQSKSKVSEGGFRGLMQMFETQGSYTIDYDTGVNRRVMPFPWNWLYDQVAEFQAMFSLPSITVYYPDMSGMSPESFRDRFGDFYDNIDARLGEVTEGVTNVGEESVDAFTSLPSKATKIFVPDGADAGADRDWIAEAKTASKEIMDYKKSVESSLSTFDDLYAAISNLPLVQIEPQVVHIKVPYLSRAQILAIMADLEEWIADAEFEIDRVRENWTSCPAGTPIEDCSGQQALFDHVNTSTNRLTATARTNLTVLQEYLNLPEIIGSIDMAIAQWLSQVLCFLDTSIFSLIHWYVLNKQRLEAWISLYFFMQEIISSWEIIKDFFLDFESFCHDCRVDRGGLVLSTFQMFMGIIPTPPIVYFPRLPNLTLDLTQLKGGVTIPVPKPDIRFVPIIFPKVPRLSLPDSPSFNITLPGIPLIPMISAVPPVPPFPEIPIIELPDLPPPPRIPDLPDFIGEFLSLAKPFLYIYCLYKNGIFPHPEMDLKSVIEDLTMRPVLSMTKFDFSGALFEDFQIPSVRELNIALQMNLDMYAADYLVDAMRAAVLPWNTATTDLRMQAEVMKRDAYSTLQMMQYNIEEIPDQELDLSGALGAADTEVAHPLQAFFAQLGNTLQSDDAYFDVSALRQKYGAKPIRLPEHFPAVDELRVLRGNIARLQADLLEEHRVLLATRDVTRLKGDFVADSALASAVYETDIQGGLPALTDFADTTGTTSASVSDFLAQLESDAAQLEPDLSSLLQQAAEDPLNVATAIDENDIVSSGDDLVQQQGYFGQCTLDGEELSGRILYHQGFADTIKTNLMLDLDLDGDEEMVIINTNGVFVKENHSFEHDAFHFTIAPEIGSFDAFVPVQEAVKNIRVVTRADGAKITFEPRFDNDLLGIEITAREQPSGYDHEDESKVEGVVLTALLVPTRFLAEGERAEAYVPNDTFQIGPWLYSGTLFVSEFINQQVELPLPVDRFWHIRVREIRIDGFSTGSEAVLAAPEAAIDTQAPIILGTLQSEAVLYEDVDLTVPIFDDGSSANTNIYSADERDTSAQKIESAGFESPIDLFDTTLDTSVTPIEPQERNYLPNALSAKDFGFVPEKSVLIEWDLNNDGVMDAQGEAISFRPKRPGSHHLMIRATDRSGNITEEHVVIDVIVPKIMLDQEQLANGVVSGEISPKYAGMPFVILRERDGRRETLQTTSADADGRYFTERFGRFSVDDFDFSPGAALRDKNGDVLAAIDRESGRVLFEAEGFSLSASPQGEMRVIEDATGRVLFSLRHLTDGNADVQVVPEPIDFSRSDLPQGVYLFDSRPDDAINAGLLPAQAPSFAGGAMVYTGSHNIAAISPIGEVVVLDANYTLQVKRSESSGEPVVLQIVDRDGGVLFDLLVRTNGNRLFLTKAQSPELPLGRAAVLSSPPPVAASQYVDQPFSDVAASHPAFAAIETLRNKKIVQGFADGSFRPDDELSRAEFVKMTLAAALCRDCALGEETDSETATSSFLDIATGAWYRFCVELAHSLGIVNGFADQTFRPDTPITRAEAAAILLRAAGIPLTSGISERILDLPADAWYFAEMLTAVDAGLIPVHFGNVYPEEPITRGEFAQMATKVLETNACQVPGPTDVGVTIDLCPQVPEDQDGIDDADGCPEFDAQSQLIGVPAGIYITSYTGDDYPYLDFIADLIVGDRVSVAIVAEEGDEVYSQSPIYEIPFDFVPAS